MAEAQAWRERAARARERLAAGDLAAARAEAEAVIAGASGGGERGMAHLVLSACCQKSGDAAAALAHARSAVDLAPLDPLAHYALAELQEKAGDVEAAIASLRRAVEVQPGFAPAQRHLGILLGERGDNEGALAAFEAAVAIDPNHARTWNNLGNAQRALGRLVDAERSFVRALALRPDYWLAAANLGQIQRDQGEVVRAEATLRAALARQTAGPPFRPLIVLLAGLLRERGAYDETIALYRQAIELAPAESGSQWFNLAWVHIQRGEVTAAHSAYVRGQKSDASELRNLLGMHLALPMIYADHASLRSARDGFAAGLETLSRELPEVWRGLPADQVLDGLRWTNFFLAYQGEDDRELQARYAALAAHAIDRAAPHWRAPIAARPAGNRRRRVGFASAFFHDGTCGRYFRSWITDLDRDRFEVFVYHLFPGMDNVASAVMGRADCFRTFGGSRARPSIVAPAIRADELDVLVYPELGMDVCSFGLAALRLAPLQFAGWGHPVTTGHAMIDAFISCDSMESAQAPIALHRAADQASGDRHALRAPRCADRRDAGNIRFSGGSGVAALPPIVVEDPPRQRCAVCRGAHGQSRRPAAALQRAASSGNRPAHAPPGALFRAAWARHTRTRARPAAGATRRLSAHQSRLRCDARHACIGPAATPASMHSPADCRSSPCRAHSCAAGRAPGMLSLLGLPELIARDRADYLAIAARLCGDAAWRHECATRIRAGQRLLFDVPDAIDALQKVLLQEDVPPA